MLSCAGTPPPPPLGCCCAAAAAASPLPLLLRESGGPSYCRNRSLSRAFSSRRSSSCNSSSAAAAGQPASCWTLGEHLAAPAVRRWCAGAQEVRNQSSTGRAGRHRRQAGPPLFAACLCPPGRGAGGGAQPGMHSAPPASPAQHRPPQPPAGARRREQVNEPQSQPANACNP